LLADAAADMLDKISIALGVFGSDQGFLNSNAHNAHYAELLGFSDDCDTLDRLRKARPLPEQRDFANYWRSRPAPTTI